jgi:hypothetical protein
MIIQGIMNSISVLVLSKWQISPIFWKSGSGQQYVIVVSINDLFELEIISNDITHLGWVVIFICLFSIFINVVVVWIMDGVSVIIHTRC